LIVERYALADFIVNDYAVFPFPGAKATPSPKGPKAVISLKNLGSMSFDPGTANPNRPAFFCSLGIGSERVVAVKQIHSRDVVFAGRAEDAFDVRADGILTDNKNLVPSVTVADCAPIWLYDAGSGAFGVVHSGWQGTGILVEAVNGLINRFDTDPSDISVIIGPCIGPCCYTVDNERAVYFSNKFGKDSVVESVSLDGSMPVPRLDLRAANVYLSGRLGIGSVGIVEDCTSCSNELGSFRREGAQTFTRMAAIVGYL
jgi:polyphenol oxidase